MLPTSPRKPPSPPLELVVWTARTEQVWISKSAVSLDVDSSGKGVHKTFSPRGLQGLDCGNGRHLVSHAIMARPRPRGDQIFT